MKVVCLGEALIDLSPPPGKSISDSIDLTVRIGGAPLNVAIHLKRSGVDARFVGTLSTDGFGSHIRALLHAEGVEYVPIEPVNSPTRLAVIDHAHHYGPKFTFYGDHPADTRLTVRAVNEALDSTTNALYLGSLLMTHPLSAKVQIAAIRRAQSLENVAIVSDPNPRSSTWASRDDMIAAVEYLLRHSNLVKLSLGDARALGWPEQPASLMRHLRERTTAVVVITGGASGCWFEDGDDLRHVPAPSQIEVDPTGAGDAFFASAIAGYLRERRLNATILTTASAAGAAVAGRRGAL